MDIYEKWQRKWEEAEVFNADPDSRPKIFINGAYPYVNGRPHIGHFFSTFLGPDVYARYKRMKGYNVLYPQGFHATGQPIAAAARRLREGDPVQRRILLASGVPEEEIEKFKDRKYWINYFISWWKHDLKKAGNSIDWRRSFHTTELNPAYDKFIRWQYRKLRKLGLIERGKHPVVWCPKEQIPIADHDRAEGEGIVPEEVVAIKFPFEGKYLVAITYRPETIYGVTNIWINPNTTYVEVETDGERWIISEEAYERLSYQREMKVLREINPEELLGKRAAVPVDGRKVPILPATFVDPTVGTGVVMSVPAHAPYDWIAVEEIRSEVEKYGVDPAELEPIPLIELDGYSEYPAADAVKKYGAKTQEDREALEKATEEIYKKEFYEGRLRALFGEYAGMKVSEAKERIIEDLKKKGFATTLYILPGRVVCRCGAEGVVKIVEQWFLRYSDEEWKEKARKTTKETAFTPEETRPYIH
jgi:leucyl-tRNA synthetase